jgi:hypothetical protein
MLRSRLLAKTFQFVLSRGSIKPVASFVEALLETQLKFKWRQAAELARSREFARLGFERVQSPHSCLGGRIQGGYMGAEATLGKWCAKHGNTFHHDVSAAPGP